ncbi:unnamed protein product [Trifolium pratense]|uniref:Uncharacterized protein n=1 Tax=Trifolium pratense TaxID=57577 RepID=A0ACB0KKP2_TRIPR|nr:unnamed protein product [Trifolium pratense]
MKIQRRNNNADEKKDRLSDLSDCALLHILSILNIKEAVQTCILSTRWKNLWKQLSILSLNSSQFKTLGCFNKFVSRLLSLRDKRTAVQALNFNSQGIMQSSLLNRIFKYAVSHHIQQLNISAACYIEHFSLCYLSSLSCHTLMSLNLSANNVIDRQRPIFPNSLYLPALTSLCLKGFAFCGCGSGNDGRAEPFSTFNNLNTLTIYSFEILDEQLFVSNVTLVNLTIKSFDDDYCKLELYTPSLCNFDFKGKPVQKLGGSNRNLSSIKHVSIDIPMWSIDENYPAVLLNWLTELVNMESLTVSLYILQVLCSILDSVIGKVDFPYLCNLKSLKVKTLNPTWIPGGVVNSLLQNTPSAEYKIIDLSR